MTTEETAQETIKETTQEIPKEPGQFLALLEEVKKQQCGLSETHLGHVEHLAATERRFEARFKQVEHEIMELDVKLSGKVGALAIGIERIAVHLGLGQVIPPGPAG